MKRYDIFVIFILEIIMLLTWTIFGMSIVKESQQTITKATCIEFFNNL